jgi:hypothetical protein
LAALIKAKQVALLGAVRQESLCGIRDATRFELIREYMADFPDVPMETPDYEMAAAYFNLCRGRGIQGSNTDFLLCAVSARRQFPIYTFGQDFAAFARFLPISLHRVAP